MPIMNRLWQKVLKELAAHPKQIDPDSLASADWVLHRRLCPEVVAALQRQKPSLSLVFAWASARELKRALAVAERLKPNAWEHGRALWFIAVAEAEADAPPRALRILESIHSSSYRSDALKDIALVLIKRRRFTEALPLAARIDNYTTALFAYTKITDVFLRAQQLPLVRTSLAQAFALAEKKKDTGHALWYLVPLEFRVGGLQEAQQRVQQISTWREITAEGRVYLARAQAEIGDREAARLNFTLAENEFATIPDPEVRVMRFLNLARAQLQGRDAPAALATLARAVDYARPLPSSDKRNEALGDIVAEQARAGDISQALSNLRLLEDSNGKLRAIESIVRAQTQAGDISGAKSTALILPYPEVQAYLLVAIGLVQAEQHDLQGSRQTFSEATRALLLHPELKVRSCAFNVVSDQASSGDGLGAEQNLQQLRKHLGPRAISMVHYLATMIVRALVPSGATDRVLSLLPSIPDKGDRICSLCNGILAKHDPQWDKTWSDRYGTAICQWSWLDMNAIRNSL